MLQANDSDGNAYIASSLLDKKDYFYKCPVCGADVFLKHDHLNVFSFSHYTEINHDWEPETYKHILMKMDIYNYFKDFPWIKTIEFERPVFTTNNTYLIPDIYIESVNDDKIAIECQNIIYTESKINNKTKEYSKNDVKVLWIFSNKFTKKFAGGYKYCNIAPTIKVKCIFTLLKNIFYKRFYVYNDCKSDNIYCDINVVKHVNSITDQLNKMSETEQLKTIIKRSDIDFKNKQHEYNKCFKMLRLPYIMINNGNDVLIIHDEQFKYNKNYNMLFTCDSIYFRNYDDSNKFLRLFFNKIVNFNNYDISKINDNSLIVDKSKLTEFAILNKLKNNDYKQSLQLNDIFNIDYFKQLW